MDVTQGFCCFQKPFEDFLEFAYGALAARGEVSFGVFDRAGEGVDVVMQTIEFVARDDQLVLAQLKFASPLVRDPIPLTASLATEQLWATRTTAWWQDSPTPPAMTRSMQLRFPGRERWHQFRHDVNTTRQRRSIRSSVRIV
jgi:hypothetical protein